MSLQEALDNFAIALGNLKRAYAEEYCLNPNYVEIHIDEGDYVTMYPSDVSGSYFAAHREWVDTDKE